MPSSPSSSELRLPTPLGDGRAFVHRARRARATLVLGHGAGTGTLRSPDLLALAAGLPAAGIAVVLVDQPWVVAGRRIAPAPARLDEAWLAMLPQLAGPGLPRRVPLVVGGRSAGARVACRTAVAVGAVAVVTLAFPLHPPGRPDRSRAAELELVRAAGLPLLAVQGERDAFGGPDQLPPGLDVRAVPGDHSLRRPAGLADLLVAAVRDWVLALE